MAQKSMVLVKNDGLLPLSRDLKEIAVIGPNADELMSLLGNYYGTPSRPVTALDGIRQAVGPGTTVRYARGTDLIEGREDPRAVAAIEAAYLRPRPDSAERGLTGEYFKGREPAGSPVMTRVDQTVDFRWYRGSPTSNLVARGEMPQEQGLENDDYSVRWTGQLLPPATGEYEITVTADDGFRLYLDDRLVIDEWTTTPRMRARTTRVPLEAGRPHDVRLEYFESIRDAEVRLGWKLPGTGNPFDEALEAARRSEVVVFVGGLNGDVEGEEMEVKYPGFAGGDRTSIALPAPQDQLLRALHATGKPVALVLMTGSAISVEWAEENLPAILVAWYPGQRGGNAIADVLFGDVSPGGRLPVTFYRSVDQLPPFDDYDMKGRTYRYFEGDPLYPFGYGLSYTRFEYSDLKIDPPRAGVDDAVAVTASIRNAGKVAGDEVVQLYARAVDPDVPMPLKVLRGFERLSLKPGEEREVRFTLTPAADLAIYDTARKAMAVARGEYDVLLGASSVDIRLQGRIRVE